MAAAVAAQAHQQRQKVVESTLTRISQHKGVQGLLVLNPKDGALYKWLSPTNALDEKKALLHADKLWQFVSLTSGIVRTLDTQNDLTFLRVRGRKYEYIIAPERDYTLVVIQDYRVRQDEERMRKQAERDDRRRQAQQGRRQDDAADAATPDG
eukprot:TRINITY_DN5245_c0_g2_i1.p2 TRINITY_DN5245_c0_g2~~TRINITY_DN5245_c0_g2_i1.p2  ORF type:complete len:153 (+),score=51.64 TRINITY_DN5245_c0_g2_i1:124-582(+)